MGCLQHRGITPWITRIVAYLAFHILIEKTRSIVTSLALDATVSCGLILGITPVVAYPKFYKVK